MPTDKDLDLASDAVQRMQRLAGIIPPLKAYSRERLVQELVLVTVGSQHSQDLNLGYLRGLLRLIEEASKPDA